MKKKILIGCSIGLMAMCLAACGSSSSAKDDKDDDTISIMAPYQTSEPPAKNGVIEKKLEKLTGTKLDITWVSFGSYSDKVNVTMASGKLPDVIVFKTKPSEKSAKAGAFWELSDYLKDYPNLSKADPTILKNSSINGKVYGIYRRRDTMRATVTLRKDWLEKLNLNEPESIDDLNNVMKAFTEKDPDGNGKDDTYGLLMNKWDGINNGSPYDVMATWFGAPNGWGEKDNGDLYPAFMSDAYLKSLDWWRTAIANGYVNKDFATNNDDPVNYMVKNKGGAFFANSYGADLTASSKIGAEQTMKEITFTGNLKGPDGQLRSYASDGFSGELAITKQSVKTEKKLKKILKFIDRTCDKDAQILMNDGIEGENFKADANGLTAYSINPDSTENKALANELNGFFNMGTYVQGIKYYTLQKDSIMASNEEKHQELMKKDQEYAVKNPAVPFSSDTATEKGATLDNIIVDARIKYISGQIDKDGWEKAINEWLNSGGKDIISELSKLNKENK